MNIEIKLSDGRIAKIENPKGKHLFEAQRLANSPSEIQKMLITIITKIDDKPITEFDLEDMELNDVLNLLNTLSDLVPKS